MEINYAAIAAIVDYLSEPREARTVKEIGTAVAAPVEEVKDCLKALKEADIVKSAGRGSNMKWFIMLDIELPVHLPDHLREPAPSLEAAESATDTDASGPASHNGTAEHSEDAAAPPDTDTADEDQPATAPDAESPAEAEPAPPVSQDEPRSTDDGSPASVQDLAGGDSRDDESVDKEPDDTEDVDATAAAETDEDAEDAERDEEDSGAVGDQEWTVGKPLERGKSSFGMIDLEVMSVFNLLPAPDADSGVDMAYLGRYLGAAMSTTRITKALWIMWQNGIAQACGLFRPDRGEWKLAEGAQLDDLKQVSMTKAPRRVTCPACGHDTALNYKQGATGPVRPFDPDAPAPDGLDDRSSQPGFGRCPEVMFCAMVLDQGDPMRAEEIAEFTGHQLPVVLQALWAMRACRIVECSEVHRPGGGLWRASESTIERAHLVRLTDAPSALGCATCGQSITTRTGNPGAARAGGKATKGVPRPNTHDGGTALPNGSLGRMIRAWAPFAPGLEPSGPGLDPTVHTPGSLFKVLRDACESGAMFDWLADLAERFPEEAEKIGQVTTAIGTDARPRSSGAVKNALVELAAADGVPIERDWDAKVETYRSTVEPATASAPDDHADEQDLDEALAAADEPDAEADTE
jgi:hypothetical protein